MAIKSFKKSKKLGVVSKKKKIVSKKSRKMEVGLSPDKNFNRQSPSNLDSKKKSTKRVSFSNRIEAQSPEPPDSVKQVITPRSESLPSKGILRVKAVSNGAEITPKSAKFKDKLPRVKQDTLNFEAMEVDEPVMVKPKLRKSNEHGAKLDKKLPKFDAGVMKKPKLMVKKSLKEKLLEMDRRQRKAFIRALREKSRPNFHLAMEVKLSWEKLRSSKTPPNVKEDCIQKIMSTVKGHLKDLIYAHDTSRVVQCLMALKRDDIRKALFDELLPEIVRMTKSQYARFFVKKMLKYGTREQKDQIINAFQGHCVKIYRIVWAAEVLEDAYNNHANAQQRLNILNEFYGKEYVLYKQSSPSLQLSEIIANDPAKKASIALNLEEALQPAVEKTTLKLSLTHKLLLEFFTVCSSEQRDNMVESLKDKIPEICITREGSRVGLFCVWNSKAAERKAIVKSFKGTVLNACKHEFAHRVLLGIFDCVDDTKLINKYILQEISNYIADIMLEKYGQKVLHYLVNPRDPRYFFKGEQELYKQGDNNEHSKKPKEVRYKELFEYIQESLYTYMAANMKELVFNKVTSMLVLNSLELPLPTDLFKREVGVSYRSSCYQALAEVVGEEFIPHNIEGPKHIIESGCGRFILNNLLRADKKFQDIKLSDHLAHLPKEHLASFIAINNGCFVLKNMCESGSVTARNVVKSCVSIKALEKSPFVGAQWLLKELKKH